MNVELKLIDPRYKSAEWAVPDYKTAGAAAIDVLACIDKEVSIPPGAVVMIPLGIAVHMDNTEVAAILLPRSGLGTKDGVILGNTLGLIDSDFQGQIQAPVWNRNFADPYEGGKVITIKPGDRIAQLMFIPVIRPSFKVVTEFSETTERGEGGFGSTGITDPAAKVDGSSAMSEKLELAVEVGSPKTVKQYVSEFDESGKKNKEELINEIVIKHGMDLYEAKKDQVFRSVLGDYEQLKRILDNTIRQRSMSYAVVHFKEIVRGYSCNAVEMFLNTMGESTIRNIYIRHYGKKPLSATFGS
ncbi:dUTP pyrophosphatase [Serratia phage vB_SmaS-Totoro]|nr:dUTP pyrophosphatase [Serratia phage vB_SmaS-Totoro]